MAFDDEMDDRSEEEEEEEEEGEDLDEDEDEPDFTRKRKASSLIDEVASEEDDEPQSRGRGAYHPRVTRFIDDQVAVDDDDDEKDDELSDADEDFEPEHELAEPHPKPMQYQRYEASRDNLIIEDEERLEEMIKQRYAQVEYTQEATKANEQSLLPNQLDPKLWMVQCRPGSEKQLCLQLMNKYITYRERDTPLDIKSAISLDHLKGFFYVEAKREIFVRDAIQGLNQVSHSKGIKLVPLEEMVDAIRPNRVARMPIEIGSWVRIRSGPYANDLAKVSNINHSSQRVELKVVPRIDYVELANRIEGRLSNKKRDPFGKKQTVRPLAKAFSSEECRSLGLVVDRRRGLNGEVYMYIGSYCFQDGYLIKAMSMRSVIVEESAPPLDELRRFEAAGQSNVDPESGLPVGLEAIKGRKHGLMKGDFVRVLRGDLMGATGTVYGLCPNNMVSVDIDYKGVKEILQFNADVLVKNFAVGDYIRVHQGVHIGQLGVIIKVENEKCLVLADLDKHEFWVSAKDLSRTLDSSLSTELVGKYDVEDLVELENHQFGVITLSDKDTCHVLLAAGSPEAPEVRRLTPHEIKCKVEGIRKFTNDKFKNRVGVGDIVDFSLFSNSRKSGTVRYVCNPYVFIKMKNTTRNLGYVAILASSAQVRGGQKTRFNPRSDSWSSEAEGGGRGSRGGRYFLRGRGRGRYSHRASVMVKVIKGAHRGFRGRVKGETATHVRVELDAGSKIINLLKSNVECLEDGHSMDSYGSRQATTGGEGSFGQDWNWSGETSGELGASTGSLMTVPKTPYGSNHPPTTPYVSRESMTSPRYTPMRDQGVIKDTNSDSDDDMRFGSSDPPPVQVKSTTSPVQAIESRGITSPDQSPIMSFGGGAGTGKERSLNSLSSTTRLGVIVKSEHGVCGVTTAMLDDQRSEIEVLSITQGSEGRSFIRQGKKECLNNNILSLLTPEKNDWVHVLENSKENSVGQIVNIDGNECIVRLHGESEQIQVFPGDAIAVSLPIS
eukprot:g2402.t1